MKRCTFLIIPLAIAFVLGLGVSVLLAENIDPDNDGSQYAYGENVGWFNFEPALGPGVTVTDTEVTGYVWAENIGWINLSPADYGGVTNDGDGNLSGYAWGENVGWINFAPTGAGVTINPLTGNFNGKAWGENIGWISFASEGAISYGVTTSWRADNDGNQAPEASFTADPTSGEAPLSVSLDATASDDPDGTIDSYDWAFGDGSTGSGDTTGHQYVSAGTYTVTLTVSDDDGDTDTTTVTITVTASAPPSGGGSCFISAINGN